MLAGHPLRQISSAAALTQPAALAAVGLTSRLPDHSSPMAGISQPSGTLFLANPIRICATSTPPLPESSPSRRQRQQTPMLISSTTETLSIQQQRVQMDSLIYLKD